MSKQYTHWNTAFIFSSNIFRTSTWFTIIFCFKFPSFSCVYLFFYYYSSQFLPATKKQVSVRRSHYCKWWPTKTWLQQRIRKRSNWFSCNNTRWTGVRPDLLSASSVGPASILANLQWNSLWFVFFLIFHGGNMQRSNRVIRGGTAVGVLVFRIGCLNFSVFDVFLA